MAGRVPVLLAILVLALSLSGCLAEQKYPVAAPDWAVGDWWTFKDAEGRTATLVVLANLDEHSLVAKVDGDRPEPSGVVRIVAVNRHTLRQDGSWDLGRDGLAWGLADAEAAGRLPLARFPLQPESSWQSNRDDGLVPLLGTAYTTRVSVDGSAERHVAGRDVQVVRLRWKLESTDVVFGIPAERGSDRASMEYSPRLAMISAYEGSAVFRGKHAWFAPTVAGDSGRMVAVGHLPDLVIDAYLDAERSSLVAGGLTLQTPTESFLVEARLAVRATFASAEGCPDGRFLAFSDGNLMASAPATVGPGGGGCLWSADLELRGPFAGDLVFETVAGGAATSATNWPVRAGLAQDVAGTCLVALEPCEIWKGGLGAGEQLLVDGRFVSPVPQLVSLPEPLYGSYLLYKDGSEVERVPRTGARLFATVGDGSAAWSILVDQPGAYDYVATVAAVPPLPGP